MTPPAAPTGFRAGGAGVVTSGCGVPVVSHRRYTETIEHIFE